MSTLSDANIAIVGAGIIGISTAYYLARKHCARNIVLIDQGQPMAFTSAQSGENYRNWWPHPMMATFTDRSIDLMEDIARESNNRIAMTRRGYILCTRNTQVQSLIDEIHLSRAADKPDAVRCHTHASSTHYHPPTSPRWEGAPTGFDVLQNQDLIRSVFPSLEPEVKSIIHIRRAGDISGQQLGQYMLEWLREHGCRRITGIVKCIARNNGFELVVESGGVRSLEKFDNIVNAAGPFAGEIAKMLGQNLPLNNVVQQKIAFPDELRAIPRDLPFAIDLDRQLLDWTDEEQEWLAQEPATARLAEEMPGAIHCRPDGGDGGNWIKLGWAYNEAPQPVSWDVPIGPQFPEIVLRGASRLNPRLKQYYGRLPRQTHHYGGWYTRTADNWPLIGPMDPDGSFMACALSGHGTMAACATGELAAAWLAGDVSEYAYAPHFSLERFRDASLGPPARTGDGLL